MKIVNNFDYWYWFYFLFMEVKIEQNGMYRTKQKRKQSFLKVVYTLKTQKPSCWAEIIM